VNYAGNKIERHENIIFEHVLQNKSVGIKDAQRKIKERGRVKAEIEKVRAKVKL
jgi:hypothetical protein